jgi:hypothetical protein
MPSKIEEIIETAVRHGRFYSKFVSANDVGLTGAHQEGLYIAKSAGGLFLPREGKKGENLENLIKIHLEDGTHITSRAIWYGKGTREEYRITKFWAYTPYDREEQVGNLIILIKSFESEFICYILNKEQDIEDFIEYFGLNLIKGSATYGLSSYDPRLTETKKALILERAINGYAKNQSSFPFTMELALKAREIYFEIMKGNFRQADNTLLSLIDIEYKIFKAIEQTVYAPYLTRPFEDLDSLIDFANSALNRRKSRAGMSLEHHVDFILRHYNIPFDHPGRSEGNKKPDFLLPSNIDYANSYFDTKKLTMLGVKTTCKDRWRQILNEADRIPSKYLLTLQQGISKRQLEEMETEKVILVVPKAYQSMYPKEFQHKLLDINSFILLLKEKYNEL